MAPYAGEPSHAQQVALAMIPKIAGFCSMMGSGYIVYDIIRRHRKKSTYHRIMLGLSLADIIMSFGLFTSTWPMPRDTPDVWGAVGTMASCATIGFLEQAGVGAVLYSASLSTYYLLRIRCGWNETQLKRVEPWFHAVPITIALATMVAGIPLDLYNSGIFDCWIAPLPLNCNQSWTHADTSDPFYVPCERGDNASIYQWAFDIVPKFLGIFLVTINMILTYRAVRRQETLTLRLSMTNDNKHLKLSQRLARQSYLYVGALYITYIPVAMTRMTQLIKGYTFYGMILTIAITIPLQGCWNVIVYLRPRYMRIRDKQRQEREREEKRRQQEKEKHLSSEDKTNSSSAHSNSSLLAAGFFPLKKSVVGALSEAIRQGELNDEDDDTDRQQEPEREAESQNENEEPSINEEVGGEKGNMHNC